MKDLDKKSLFEAYNERTHAFGRAACIVTLVLLIGAPFVMGLYLGAMPNLAAVARGFLAVGLVWMVSCIAEYLVYTPMLGAGGGYLAFITGNLKIAVLPLFTMSLLFLLVPSLTGSTRLMVLPSGAIAIAVAFLLFKKGSAK